jgi:D-glycero-D-manno-heptose 1,7-bisphosphate phosphatase
VAARELSLDLGREFHGRRSLARHRGGRAAGCRTVFVDHGYNERRPTRFDKQVSSLAEAAAWILSEQSTC